MRLLQFPRNRPDSFPSPLLKRMTKHRFVAILNVGHRSTLAGRRGQERSRARRPIQKGDTMKQISRIPSASFLLVGALCIFFPSHVAGVLPFLLGGIMLIAGIVHGAAYLRDKRFLEDEPQGIGPDIILAVMGVAFLCAGSEAVGLMGVVWGIIGLRKAAGTIDQALRRMYRHQPALLLATEAAIRIVLALFGVFRWFGDFLPHIFGSTVLFSVAMVLYLLNSRLDASAKLTWLLVITLLPVFGALMYLFTQSDLGRRHDGADQGPAHHPRRYHGAAGTAGPRRRVARPLPGPVRLLPGLREHGCDLFPPGREEVRGTAAAAGTGGAVHFPGVFHRGRRPHVGPHPGDPGPQSGPGAGRAGDVRTGPASCPRFPATTRSGCGNWASAASPSPPSPRSSPPTTTTGTTGRSW